MVYYAIKTIDIYFFGLGRHDPHSSLLAGLIVERQNALGEQQIPRKMYWSTTQTIGDGLYCIGKPFPT